MRFVLLVQLGPERVTAKLKKYYKYLTGLEWSIHLYLCPIQKRFQSRIAHLIIFFVVLIIEWLDKHTWTSNFLSCQWSNSFKSWGKESLSWFRKNSIISSMFEVPWESFEYKLRNSDHLIDGYKDERFIKIIKRKRCMFEKLFLYVIIGSRVLSCFVEWIILHGWFLQSSKQFQFMSFFPNINNQLTSSIARKECSRLAANSLLLRVSRSWTTWFKMVSLSIEGSSCTISVSLDIFHNRRNWMEGYSLGTTRQWMYFDNWYHEKCYIVTLLSACY